MQDFHEKDNEYIKQIQHFKCFCMDKQQIFSLNL